MSERESLTVQLCEELGVVLQTTKQMRSALFDIFRSVGLGKNIFEVGSLNKADEIVFYRDSVFLEKENIFKRFGLKIL